MMILLLFAMICILLLVSFLSIILYPKIQTLMIFNKNRHRLLDWYTELLSESPSQTFVINRIGAPRTIVTANPANIEHILKTNFSNFPKGKPFTEILGDLLGTGIFNSDGNLWSVQRKLASHEFTARSLRSLVAGALSAEVNGKLIPLLEKACSEARVLDLQEVLRRFAFDVICRVSLGIDTCRVDLSRLVGAFDRAAEISARRGSAPVFLVWKVKKWVGIGSERELRDEIRVIRRSVGDIIATKKKKIMLSTTGFEGETDLLGRLLEAGHTEEAAIDMAVSFIMAGRDTTSAAMTWLFWLLSQNQPVETAAAKETLTIIENSSNKSISYEGLKEMNFIKACLCEAMRLFPPVPWDSKHAAKNDILPDKTRVRAGDRVTYFPYGMGRMEEIWGKDCLEFRPDRWFADPGLGPESGLKPISPFRFPVFQAGPRVCLGKEMAFAQMKYVVAAILSRFEIRPVLGSDDPPVFVPLLTAHMAGGFKVLIKRRQRTIIA